jgi:opacity protein-like surface antigen
MKLKYLFLAVAVGAANVTVKAQDYDLGLFVGISTYQGDLSPGFSNGFGNAFRGVRPAIGGLARYNFNPHLSLRGNLNFGYVASYDKYGNEGTSRERRNLSFYSPLLEASGVVELNLMKYIAGSRNYKFAPYVFAGLGAFYFEPKTFYDGDRVKLRPLATEPNKSYSPISIAIPMGLGIKYNYRDNMTFGLELGWRKTFTDYMDDVSDKYTPSAYTVTPASSLDDKLSNRSGRRVNASSIRGNPEKGDSYYFVGVSIYKTIRPFRCN